jgi:hypothetical protein
MLALLIVVGVVAVRVIATMRTHDSRRRVERTHLLASIGTLVGLALYYLTTKGGMELVGQGKLGLTGAYRWKTALTVLSAAVIAASILPMVMIEATVGVARRDWFDLGQRGDDDAVEYRRVREVGLSGLTIALALGFLMVTCNVAHQRNLRDNTAYFKTTEAGASTAARARDLAAIRQHVGGARHDRAVRRIGGVGDRPDHLRDPRRRARGR